MKTLLIILLLTLSMTDYVAGKKIIEVSETSNPGPPIRPLYISDVSTIKICGKHIA